MAKRPPSLSPNHAKPKRSGWAASSRKSRRARGYGPDWDRKRAAVLKNEPLCRSCKASGVATVATTVDHIKPKHLGGTDVFSNLQPLCDPCHKAKTASEAAAARDRRRRP